ncbi:MAG: Fic family protein [Woeseiaceae bacterium]|nr:Fic family protein [Woeseiaceae bacterium]
MPPRPADVPRLMRGLLDMTTRNPEMDAVVFAASVAFGFVFVHPFMDGNGRIHRYPDSRNPHAG